MSVSCVGFPPVTNCDSRGHARASLPVGQTEVGQISVFTIFKGTLHHSKAVESILVIAGVAGITRSCGIPSFLG